MYSGMTGAVQDTGILKFAFTAQTTVLVVMTVIDLSVGDGLFAELA